MICCIYCRGARYALLSLNEDQKKAGVVAASAGNHALALAWHGKDLDIPVTCVMPTTAPFTKVNNCRKFGANVVLYGQHIGEAKDYALETFSNMKYINGYDDKEIIAGAGTVAMEMIEQVYMSRTAYASMKFCHVKFKAFAFCCWDRFVVLMCASSLWVVRD